MLSSRPPETTLDRSVEPPEGTDRPFTAPAVQTATLANGLEIFVVERHRRGVGDLGDERLAPAIRADDKDRNR